MLIEFRVANHRSLLEEQALTFEGVNSGDLKDSRLRYVEGHAAPLSTVAAIYGANASGKSNVLDAIDFMRRAVVLSFQMWHPSNGGHRTPFAWEKSEDSSLFETTFTHDGSKYQYGFSISDEAIEEEWLFIWVGEKKKLLFKRECGQYQFSEDLLGANEVVRDITRPNALFLSTAAQTNHPQLTPVFSWFDSFFFLGEDKNQISYRHKAFCDLDDIHFKNRLVNLLQIADIGITDIAKEGNSSSKIFIDRFHPLQPIRFQHQEGEKASWLNWREESEGTKTLVRLSPLLFRTLDFGAVMVIDELESSLHPLLALAIIKLFNGPKSNPKNAQLLFTTHYTNLLGEILGDVPLRRDQVWLTEKDRLGRLHLYPLTDFEPRASENLERGYLQGR